MYSTDVSSLHQSTGRLSVPGYPTPKDYMSKDKPMTHVDCESRTRSIVRSSMPTCQDNWMSTGRAVVYYAQTAHPFRVGIKCQHGSHSAVADNHI